MLTALINIEEVFKVLSFSLSNLISCGVQQSPVGSEAAYHVLPLKLALPWVWSLL